MDFELSEEQAALAGTARDLLARRWSPERMRAALDAPPASIEPELWSELAALGWIGIATAEDAGGSGADVVTAAVLVEEAGRALLPGPFLSTLAAAAALDRSGDDRARKTLLADLVAGSLHVTLALEEPGIGWGPDRVGLRAEEEGDGWRLDGVKVLVPDAEVADVVLVAATGDDRGVQLLAVPTGAPGLTITPMRRLDAQSVSELAFDGVRVSTDALVGEPAASGRAVAEAYDIWTLLGAADLLGVTERVLEITTEYARQRTQFGRAIGSFQAVSHRLADGLVDVEIGRSLVYGAGLALTEASRRAPALVSAAKAWMSDAAVRVAETAVQVHGGIGYTWELDVHLYLRRARAGAVTLGDADHHRDRVATELERETED